MLRLLLLLGFISCLRAQTGENVLLVVNRKDPVSVQIGEYYRLKRAIPAPNVCSLDTSPQEEIEWQTYVEQIETPVGACLKNVVAI